MEKLQFHSQIYFFDVFSYFHDWIFILKLDMNRFERKKIISFIFMICFSPYLDQNIGLKFWCLPIVCNYAFFEDH